jgi:hypothetical protein
MMKQPPIRLACLLSVALITASPLGADDRSHWVGTWAASQQLTEPANLPPAPGFADTTLRQVVRVSIGGAKVRFRFSNAFGATALTLESAHVARAAGGSAIRPDTDRPLLFHGQPSVTIPAGALVVSDAIDFALAPLTDLAVTVYVRDARSDVTGHPGSRTTSYLQSGDAVSAGSMPPLFAQPERLWLNCYLPNCQ